MIFSVNVFLFIDHTDFVKGLREEVIINGGPAVISPKKASKGDVYVGEGILDAGEGSSRRVASVEFGATNSGSDDDDFVDSDYDAEDGDDDLFYDHVDKDVNDNNEKEQIADLEDDNALENDDLNLRKEEVEQLRTCSRHSTQKWTWKILCLKWECCFADAKKRINALATYNIRNRVKVSKIKNEPGRLEAVCAEGCPWWLKASSDSRSGGFIIRAYVGRHTCQRKWELKALTAPFLTKAFMDEFRDNNKMDLKNFAAKVQREYNMCPNRWKLSRARREARREIHGDEAGQFSQLRYYGQDLRSNPGSKFLNMNYASAETSSSSIMYMYMLEHFVQTTRQAS